VTRLIIWRHGQTEWNVENRMQGHTDVALDAVGHAQAAAAAATLAAMRPDVIVASDLRRTADTAAPLSAVTGLPAHLDPRIRERSFGQWQGMLVADVATTYPAEFERWRHGETVAGCDVEEIDDFAKRVSEGVLDAVAMADDGTVVVVTHGGSAKQALGGLLGWPPSVTRQVIGLSNCHWTELRHSAQRGWLLQAHNVGRTVD